MGSQRVRHDWESFTRKRKKKEKREKKEKCTDRFAQYKAAINLQFVKKKKTKHNNCKVQYIWDIAVFGCDFTLFCLVLGVHSFKNGGLSSL